MTASFLHGRHAVVTGAARGIGAAIAASLAARGARLTLLGRSAGPLEQLCASLAGGPHGTVLADVAEPAQVQAAFAAARSARGPVAILVNNAGAAESAPFGTTSLELWQRMLSVNLTGTFLCTKAALPDMLAAGWGRVINIASTAGQKGYAYASAYAAAKHGVIGLTRSLALETARAGVTVNALCPGYIATEINRDYWDTDGGKKLIGMLPRRRVGQPEDLDGLLLLLASEHSGFVNGAVIAADDGLTL